MRKQFRETPRSTCDERINSRSKMLVVVRGLSGKWNFLPNGPALTRSSFTGLGVKPSLDLFQQSSAGFTGVAGGKPLPVQSPGPLARDLEGLLRGRGRGEIGACQRRSNLVTRIRIKASPGWLVD